MDFAEVSKQTVPDENGIREHPFKIRKSVIPLIPEKSFFIKKATFQRKLS
jgi:hypothetical protein